MGFPWDFYGISMGFLLWDFWFFSLKNHGISIGFDPTPSGPAAGPDPGPAPPLPCHAQDFGGRLGGVLGHIILANWPRSNYMIKID